MQWMILGSVLIRIANIGKRSGWRRKASSKPSLEVAPLSGVEVRPSASIQVCDGLRSRFNPDAVFNRSKANQGLPFEFYGWKHFGGAIGKPWSEIPDFVKISGLRGFRNLLRNRDLVWTASNPGFPTALIVLQAGSGIDPFRETDRKRITR